MLANDIYLNSVDEHCIFSAEEALVENASELQSELIFHGHLLCLRKPMQIHKVCLGATRHFFQTDDYNWNIRMANQLWEKYQSVPHKKLDFYVRSSDDVRKAWAENWAESIQKKADIDIHLINEAALLARILTNRYPLLKSPRIQIMEKTGKANGKFSILLLGFGEVGKAILRETICNGQFLQNGPGGRVPFHVDVVDRDPAARRPVPAPCSTARSGSRTTTTRSAADSSSTSSSTPRNRNNPTGKRHKTGGRRPSPGPAADLMDARHAHWLDRCYWI